MARQAAQIGDTGKIGALAGIEQSGKLFDNGLVGHAVKHDLDVGVLFFEPVEQIAHDIAFNAVRIPHDADFGRVGGFGFFGCRHHGSHRHAQGHQPACDGFQLFEHGRSSWW